MVWSSTSFNGTCATPLTIVTASTLIVVPDGTAVCTAGDNQSEGPESRDWTSAEAMLPGARRSGRWMGSGTRAPVPPG